MLCVHSAKLKTLQHDVLLCDSGLAFGRPWYAMIEHKFRFRERKFALKSYICTISACFHPQATTPGSKKAKAHLLFLMPRRRLVPKSI